MHALFCRPTQYTQQPVEFPVEGRRGSARVRGSSNHLNGGELSVAVCRRHSSIRASERHGWVITSCRQGACVRRRRQDRSSDRAAAGWTTKSMTKYKFSSKAKKSILKENWGHCHCAFSITSSSTCLEIPSQSKYTNVVMYMLHSIQDLLLQYHFHQSWRMDSQKI